MPLTNKQQEAFDLVRAGKTIFITGPGGCGKTYLIKYLQAELQANTESCSRDDFPRKSAGTSGPLPLSLKYLNVAVTALTGIAATLIDGQTLHSWAGICNEKNSKEQILKRMMNHTDVITRWRETELLIIDEISMMSIDLLNRLNYFGQEIRQNSGFFGGLQIVFSGDFCQLPPVAQTDRFCFESKIWIENVKDIVYFKEIIRQKDPTLQLILNEVRLGILSADTKRMLNQRLVSETSLANDKTMESVNENQDDLMRIKPTILYPYNRDVDEINQRELLNLIQNHKKTSHTFTAVDNFKDWRNPDRKLKRTELLELDKILDNGCRGERQTTYCIGAQVMLTTNLDVEKGLVNGTRGVIKDFVSSSNGDSNNSDPDLEVRPVVQFQNGIEKIITPIVWKVDHPKYTITRRQYPLMLAWSISVHKAQGSTLSLVITDLSDVFAPGQAYVALSRIQSLEGLYLQGISYSKIKCHPKVKKFYMDLE